MSVLLAGCEVGLTPPDGGDAPDAGTVLAGPVLLTTVPADGAMGASVAAGLSLQFSRAIAPASLVVSIAPAVVLGAVTLEAENTEARYPAPGLQAGVAYVVTVMAADPEGRPLSGTGTFSFTTAAQVDTLPPTLQSSSPATGAMQVPVGDALTLTFSEAIEPTSLVLAYEPAVTEPAVTWSTDGKVATVNAGVGLEAATAYVVSISAADLAGNGMTASVEFTTAAAPDVLAPVVKVTAPAAASQGVPTNAGLSITFSEAMLRSTVDAAVSIVPAVAGTTLWDASDSLRSFLPSASLAPSTEYVVTVGVGATDAAGNALGAPFVFSFTTAAAADTTQPTVVSSTPEASATGVARTTNISVTFSEPMDKASAQVAFAVTLPQSANLGAFSWSADGKTMTFNPTASIAYGQNVAWRVATTAKDLAGNALASPVARGFLVIREGFKVIDAAMALDGFVSSGNQVSTTSGFLIAGDNANNVSFRSFLTFDLSALPATTTRLTQVALFAYLSGWQGSPRTTLGGSIQLERVDYGDTLTAADFDLQRFMNLGDTVPFGPNIESQGWKMSTAALFPVTNDWLARATRGNLTQFRLRFPTQLSTNGAADSYSYYSGNTQQASCQRQGVASLSTSCRPHLIVTYEYP